MIPWGCAISGHLRVTQCLVPGNFLPQLQIICLPRLNQPTTRRLDFIVYPVHSYHFLLYTQQKGRSQTSISRSPKHITSSLLYQGGQNHLIWELPTLPSSPPLTSLYISPVFFSPIAPFSVGEIYELSPIAHDLTWSSHHPHDFLSSTFSHAFPCSLLFRYTFFLLSKLPALSRDPLRSIHSMLFIPSPAPPLFPKIVYPNYLYFYTFSHFLPTESCWYGF